MKANRDRFQVSLMLEAIEEAKRDMEVGFDAFALPDSKDRKALRVDLIDLVESADHVSPAFKAANPRIDWERLRDLRNQQLVHHYPELDPKDVWSFVTEEMPVVERHLRHARFPKDRA